MCLQAAKDSHICLCNCIIIIDKPICVWKKLFISGICCPAHFVTQQWVFEDPHACDKTMRKPTHAGMLATSTELIYPCMFCFLLDESCCTHARVLICASSRRRTAFAFRRLYLCTLCQCVCEWALLSFPASLLWYHRVFSENEEFVLQRQGVGLPAKISAAVIWRSFTTSAANWEPKCFGGLHCSGCTIWFKTELGITICLHVKVCASTCTVIEYNSV